MKKQKKRNRSITNKKVILVLRENLYFKIASKIRNSTPLSPRARIVVANLASWSKYFKDLKNLMPIASNVIMFQIIVSYLNAKETALTSYNCTKQLYALVLSDSESFDEYSS